MLMQHYLSLGLITWKFLHQRELGPRNDLVHICINTLQDR